MWRVSLYQGDTSGWMFSSLQMAEKWCEQFSNSFIIEEVEAMTDQGAGGRGVIECHYCHRPVCFSTGMPTHLDLTPMCYEVLNDD